MRNATTDSIGSDINRRYKESGLPVNKFIDWMVENSDAFDFRHLHEASSGGQYAYFHIIKYGRPYSTVMTCYYWQDRDEWYTKS
jgi:hypothetical protein